MNVRYTPIGALAIGLALLAATLAPAAESVLSAIPGDSLGFVVINDLAETDARVQALAAQLRGPALSPLAMLKARTGAGEGLDENGSAAFCLVPGEDADAPPTQILFVPVTDYAKFIGQFQPEEPDAKVTRVRIMDSPFVVGRRGDYAVLTQPGARDRKVLQAIVDSTSGASEDVASWQPWVDTRNVTVVVTRRGVELIAAKGQEALREAREMFVTMGNEMLPAIAVLGIYQSVLEVSAAEFQSVAASVELREDGTVVFSKRLMLVSGGSVAKTLADVKPPEADLLAGLPADPYVLAVGGLLPEGVISALTDFSVKFMGAVPNMYGLDEEQTAKVAEVSRQSMKGLRGMSFVLGVGKKDDPIYGNVAVVMSVDNAETFLANYRKSIESFSEITKDAKDSVLTSMTVTPIEIDGTAAYEISMKYPMGPGIENLPNYEQLMEKVFGPGGKMLAYVAAADERTVVAAYTGKDALRWALAAAKGAKPTLAADPHVAKTAALLPAGAQWIGFLNPRGTVSFVNRVTPILASPGESDFRLPEFPETPPIGFAAKAMPDEIQGYLVIPAEVVKAIGQYVGKIQTMDR